MKDSINLVYGYAGGVLHWNSQQIVHLAVINIAAMVVAMLFSAYILVKKSNYSKLIQTKSKKMLTQQKKVLTLVAMLAFFLISLEVKS